jgi:phosphodiesterase/alkaline phosphatase D-like protein
MTGTGAFSADLSGLTSGTTYYYRAKAVGDGTVYGTEKTFTALAAPAVTTDNPTDIQAASARLNGNLVSLGTSGSVTVSFVWGTTAGGPYPNETTGQAKTATGAFYFDLGNLGPVTTYYYQVKAVGDGTVYGAEKSFKTIDAAAPDISVVASSGVTVSEATITWTTDEAATSQVEYGLTEEYGSITTLDTDLVTGHSVDLAGLKAGKTYHYRVLSKDASNNQAVSGDNTFTTTARSGGMPVWAWVIIALAVVAILGGGALFIRGRLAQG